MRNKFILGLSLLVLGGTAFAQTTDQDTYDQQQNQAYDQQQNQDRTGDWQGHHARTHRRLSREEMSVRRQMEDAGLATATFANPTGTPSDQGTNAGVFPNTEIEGKSPSEQIDEQTAAADAMDRLAASPFYPATGTGTYETYPEYQGGAGGQ